MKEFSKNDFTELDKGLVIALLRKLPPRHKSVMTLKFWENYDSFQIASALRMSYAEVVEVMQESLNILKSACLLQPSFSRNILVKSHCAVMGAI